MRDNSGRFLIQKSDEAFDEMAGEDILALEIRAQNAGLAIRGSHDQYPFESLELSATN